MLSKQLEVMHSSSQCRAVRNVNSQNEEPVACFVSLQNPSEQLGSARLVGKRPTGSMADHRGAAAFYRVEVDAHAAPNGPAEQKGLCARAADWIRRRWAAFAAGACPALPLQEFPRWWQAAVVDRLWAEVAESVSHFVGCGLLSLEWLLMAYEV